MATSSFLQARLSLRRCGSRSRGPPPAVASPRIRAKQLILVVVVVFAQFEFGGFRPSVQSHEFLLALYGTAVARESIEVVLRKNVLKLFRD